MLDHFLEVAYQADTEAKEKRAFVGSLKGLPMEDLAKLASGETTLAKLAHGDDDYKWLDKYKGGPLFDQALALEQAELQNSMAQQQAQMQQPESQQFWREKDKICLQKRMLDLQLVQSEQQALMGAQLPSPEAPAQGAGAPGMGAPNNEEMMGASSEQGTKVSSAPLWMKLGSEKKAFSVTEKGHKLDAEMSRMHERHGAETMHLLQQHGIHRGGELAFRKPGSTISAPHMEQIMAAKDIRHSNYTAKKHEKGENAYNPFGGMLTPSKYEGHDAGTLAPGTINLGKTKEANLLTAFLPEIIGAGFGAAKGARHGEPGEGALRGAAGAGLGSFAGSVAGGIALGVTGGILGGLAAGQGGALVGGVGGVLAGGATGGLVGGVKGYKHLTKKYDKKKTAAPNFGAMGSAIKQNLGRVAKTMPTGALMHAGIGAGVGAVGGAVAGGPDHRLSGALGGAALGGAGGLAGSNIARAAKAGGGLTGATAMKGLADTGRQVRAGGNAVIGGVKKGLRAGEGAVAGAPAAAGTAAHVAPAAAAVPGAAAHVAPAAVPGFPGQLGGLSKHRRPRPQGSFLGSRYLRGLLGGRGHDVGHARLHLPGASVGVTVWSVRRSLGAVLGPVRLRGQYRLRRRPLADAPLHHPDDAHPEREGSGFRARRARARA